MEKIYMDNASGSPVHPKVVEAMMPFLRRDLATPLAYINLEGLPVMPYKRHGHK